MQPSRLAHLTLALLLAAGCAPLQPPSAATVDAPRPATAASPAAAEWLADVDAIADAADNAGRRLAIGRQLDELGVHWRSESFTAEARTGENLLAPVSGPAAAPLLLLGAHSDRVEAGEGATDNASGSAVVLALAERFRREPLQHHRVAVAFWDLEELGLLGSKAYVASGGEKPALYVNFDVFGWGDTVWMRAGEADTALVDATLAATDAAQLGLSAGEQYPPTDHRAFLAAGWPAVSYSLVGAGEVPLILQMYEGQKPRSLPRVMQVIHHDRDVLAELEPDAVVRAIDAIEAALRRWDARAAMVPAEAAAEH
jgi:hypothetical protein